MSSVASPSQTLHPRAVDSRPPVRAVATSPTRFILPGFTLLVLLYLLFPLAIMVLFSFNQTPADRITLVWHGFTVDFYRRLFEVTDLTEGLKNSVLIAVYSTVVATILGTSIALALVRYRFRGKGATDLVLFLNIAVPEIVLGAALLSFFVSLAVPRGFGTIFLAHVMFDIPFVAVTVRARLAGYDRALEEAAQDLYADSWATFVRVTLPLIWPGIIAGAMLAFVLSIDDFVITQFVAGRTTTYPLWVYGAVKAGIPPQVFAMGTLIFTIGVIFAIVTAVTGRRATER